MNVKGSLTAVSLISEQQQQQQQNRFLSCQEQCWRKKAVMGPVLHGVRANELRLRVRAGVLKSIPIDKTGILV